MNFDLSIFVLIFSFIAAVMAGWSALRRSVAATSLESITQAISLSTDQVQRTISQEMSASRIEADQRGSALREELRNSISSNLQPLGQASHALREEVVNQVSSFAMTMQTSLANSAKLQEDKLDNVALQVQSLAEANERRLVDMRAEEQESGKSLRAEVATQLQALSTQLSQTLTANATTQKERLDDIANEIRNLTRRNGEQSESLRQIVEAKLTHLREENSAKLEEMRLTVDEKLQNTLEQRLGSSFKLVSEQLENVFKSVGEMQTLAVGVGDLKRVLTNVKNRGTWAEVSLGNLLEQFMTAEQFERSVEVKPGSGQRVDYAIRLPGGEDDAPLWLPIDAKFPSEDYERLVDASERGDVSAVEVALKGMEARIDSEAKSISSKYISPPHTTDFAILYLPTEGLYAEVIRRQGLVDRLQHDYRIVVVGPTVLLATLNSLRMGFRTLAIQKRSSEVWQLLSAVKTEFSKYGNVLDKVQKKLAEASSQIENVSVRRRAIDRQLRSVEGISDDQASKILLFNEPANLDDEADVDGSEPISV